MQRRGRIGAVALALFWGASHQAVHADVTYVYDGLGRVTSIIYDDGKRVTYNYDPTGNRSSHVVDIVSPPPANVPPVAVNDSISADQSTAYIRTFDPRINDSDANGDALTITSKSNGAQGNVVIGPGGTTLSYTFTGIPPAAGTSTTDSFTYTISDGNGGSATAAVAVTISTTSSPPPANNPPVAVNDAIAVNETSTYIRTFDPRVNDSDPNGDLLVISGKTNGSNGAVAIGIGGASLSYTFTGTPPVAGASTSDSFTYTISDGRGGSATATVNVTISTTAGSGGGGGGGGGGGNEN